MDERTVYLLIGASLILALISVLIDRINFPQRPFRPKAVAVDSQGRAARDRTGAHILDVPADGAASSATSVEPTTPSPEAPER